MIRLPWLVFWFVLLNSNSPAQAQKICLNDNPQLCSEPIKMGERASFSGQLLTPRFAIRLGQKLERCQTTFDLELEAKLKLIQLDLEFERKLRADDRKRFEHTTSKLRTELTQSQINWYEHPFFVAVTTATLTILIFVGTKYAIVEK